MKLKSYTTAPLLAALVYFLTICANEIIANLDLATTPFLLASGGIQAAAYLVPFVIYKLLFGKGDKLNIKLSPPSIVGLPCVALLSVILLLGSTLISMLFERLGFVHASVGNTISGSADFWVVILVFALVPAICEELVFRGVIMSSFEGAGARTAIVASSLLFAFAHMRLEEFFVYFFASIMLCMIVYISRSIITSIVVHFLYNILSVYMSDYISGIAAHLESFALLFIVILFIVWILILLALGEGTRVYRIYGQRGYDSGNLPQKIGYATRIKMNVSVYLSVPFLLCVLIYTAVIILSLK